MFILTTEHSFDSAHFLKGYEGKCSNIHGHRWRIVANIYSENLKEEGSERGMVVDFKRFKEDLRLIAQKYDHAFIVEVGSMNKGLTDNLKAEGFNIVELPFRPTAEELSRHFYFELETLGYKLKNIVLFETPTNYVTFEKREI